MSSNRSTPKLRTKSGCTACKIDNPSTVSDPNCTLGRARRKKCDENKPSCNGCTKLHITCIWPRIGTLVDRREKVSPRSRWSPRPTSRQVTDMEHHQHPEITTDCTSVESGLDCLYIASVPSLVTRAQIFLQTDREVILWSHYFESFLPANILPRAHPKFSRLYVGDVPELRYCMLACSSIQMSNKLDKSPEEALHYYTNTMTGLRKKLSTNKITGSEDWVFVVMILCHCFEVFLNMTCATMLSLHC